MTLNRIESDNFHEKSQKWIEISFWLQTRLSLLAMRVTFKTNVKRFVYPPEKLAVYNSTEISLASKRNIFLETCSKFLHDLEQNVVLNTMLPSDLPWPKQFSRYYMLKFRLLQIFGHVFYNTGQKITFYQKDLYNLTCTGEILCP